MTFPASLPSFTNPTSGDNLSTSVGGRTHAQMHSDVNDAIEEIAGALTAGSLTVTSWTPTFNNIYGTIPTVGAGSASGWYVTIGPLFICSFRILFGSGATAGTGSYTINPPVSAYASSTIGGHGPGTVVNGSAQALSATYEMYNGLINGIVDNSTSGAVVGASVPSGMGTSGTTINGTLIGRRA